MPSKFTSLEEKKNATPVALLQESALVWKVAAVVTVKVVVMIMAMDMVM